MTSVGFGKELAPFVGLKRLPSLLGSVLRGLFCGEDFSWIIPCLSVTAEEITMLAKLSRREKGLQRKESHNPHIITVKSWDLNLLAMNPS